MSKELSGYVEYTDLALVFPEVWEVSVLNYLKNPAILDYINSKVVGRLISYSASNKGLKIFTEIDKPEMYGNYPRFISRIRILDGTYDSEGDLIIPSKIDLIDISIKQ